MHANFGYYRLYITFSPIFELLILILSLFTKTDSMSLWSVL